jgi:hypothetical protein
MTMTTRVRASARAPRCADVQGVAVGRAEVEVDVRHGTVNRAHPIQRLTNRSRRSRRVQPESHASQAVDHRRILETISARDATPPKRPSSRWTTR